MTRPIPLRSGAKTPQARVLQRKFNETTARLAKQLGRRVIKPTGQKS